MSAGTSRGWQRLVGSTLALALFLTLFAPTLPAAQSQDRLMIESDDARVQQDGLWTSQATTQASGGSYLYSSGADDDVLTLQFSGPSIDVIYVAGPSLGTLAINVDDIVLRTVITTAETTAYQQSSRIDYLSDEPHTLKVYAQAGGIVAIDAFVGPTSPPDPASSEGEASDETRDPFCAPINQIHRVSLTSTGGQASDSSVYPQISADGRHLVFESWASLVPSDNDALLDIYAYDRATCTLELLSVSSSGQKGNNDSLGVYLSGDGRYVAFSSYATNLVADDTNSLLDVFVRDRLTSITSRVSVATGGGQALGGDSYMNGITPDGRYIVFTSDSNNLVADDFNNTSDVFVYDRQTGLTARASLADDDTEISNSLNGVISADGRYIAFVSNDNTVVSDDTNGRNLEIFVRDRQAETTTRVSVATGGVQTATGSANTPFISIDGRYVAFYSGSSDLVSGDTNGFNDVFVHDRNTTTTTRISVTSDGTQAIGGNSLYPKMSYDGRYIAFLSRATNLVAGTVNGNAYGYVHDQQSGITSLVSLGEIGSQFTTASPTPILSGDGQFITFTSDVATLVSNDTNNAYDIFVAPRFPGASDLTATPLDDGRIQLSWTDNASDETDYRLERSPDGLNNWVEIGSAPANTTTYTNVSLMCGTAYHYRVRAYRALDDTYSAYSNIANATTSPCPATCTRFGNTWLVSHNNTGNPANGMSVYTDMSGDGRYVVFTSTATDLVPNDATSGFTDIFVRDMQTCQIWQVNVASSGTQGDAEAQFPKISANGRYIAFRSNASNLVAGASGNFIIYQHDRLTGQTILISVSNTGVASNGMSFLGDVADNGRVVLNTYATNFDPDDTDTYTDTYVRDPQAGTTTLVDVSNAGEKANVGSAFDRITPNGRYVVYLSSANNLVPNDNNGLTDIFIRDLQTNTTAMVPLPTPTPPSYFPLQYVTMSDDARIIAFHTLARYLSSDTNAFYDVYVYDRLTATLTRPGVPAIGLESNGDTMEPVLSGNGRYLALNSYGNNWYHHDFNNAADVMLVDLQTNITARASETNYGSMTAYGGSWAMAMTTDGSQLVMTSGASNLVHNGQDFNNLNDIFVKARPHQPSLALFRSDYNATSQLNTLVDLPQLSAYHSFTLNPPRGGYNGQWVMGDWNGDGLRTPGVYAPNGVFYITDDSGAAGSTWRGTWFGLYGRPPVVGQFAPDGHDCIGVIDSAHFPPYGTAFALYYTCNLNGGAPPLSFQWLSVVLPDPTFSGTHQFAAGDFNGDGLDSVAVRRGEYIAFTNVAPSDGHAVYDQAQYWGVPLNTAGDEGVFLIGDWDLNNQDSFGVFYQNGYFYRRDDMQWNTGIHILQRIGQPIGAPVTATTWRPN